MDVAGPLGPAIDAPGCATRPLLAAVGDETVRDRGIGRARRQHDRERDADGRAGGRDVDLHFDRLTGLQHRRHRRTGDHRHGAGCGEDRGGRDRSHARRQRLNRICVGGVARVRDRERADDRRAERKAFGGRVDRRLLGGDGDRRDRCDGDRDGVGLDPIRQAEGVRVLSGHRICDDDTGGGRRLAKPCRRSEQRRGEAHRAHEAREDSRHPSVT